MAEQMVVEGDETAQLTGATMRRPEDRDAQ
jgi:hypothetical protein